MNIIDQNKALPTTHNLVQKTFQKFFFFNFWRRLDGENPSTPLERAPVNKYNCQVWNWFVQN